MTLLRSSLHLLLFTAGVSLFGAVPAPSFTSGITSSTGGQSVVNIVGSKTAPKLVNGADSGKDTILPVRFSGFSNTWDVATADASLKRIVLRVQGSNTTANNIAYSFVNVATTDTPTD